jgi:glutathione S-transferase
MITVWGRRSSVNVQKVLWALGEAGVEFDRVTVGGSFGGLDTREYKKLNPMQLVPAIKDGTITMAESHAILRYVSRRYGKGTLQPRGFRALALAEQWVEWTATTFAPAIAPIFMNKIRKPAEEADEQAVKRAVQASAKVFRLANGRLGRRPFVAGKAFSYGDIPLGATYWRYKNLEIDRPPLPNLDRWFEALQERPAYREWVMVPFGRNVAEWNVHERELK